MNPGPVSSQLQKLEDVLRRQGCFETPKGLEARREALKNLNILVSQWIQSASLSRGMHWQDVDKIGGRIVTYGSYMLGISHQGTHFSGFGLIWVFVFPADRFLHLVRRENLSA